MDILKALSGVSGAAKGEGAALSGAPATDAPAKKTADGKESDDKYNPMASVLERHERAMNRIKRGK